MILNGHAVLDAFVVAIRCALSLLVVGLAVGGWRRQRRDREMGNSIRPRRPPPLESSAATGAFAGSDADRGHLVELAAIMLCGLNLAGWPLLYLLWQSYVPQWPDVMCIYGVTRIGAGSQGIASWLPPLTTALQGLKPLVVFASGIWLILHDLNRRTATATLQHRLWAILMIVGVISLMDATCEAAYLAIPKQSPTLSEGCCASLIDDVHRPDAPGGFTPEDDFRRALLSGAMFVWQAGLILGLVSASRSPLHRLLRLWVPALALGAIISLPLAWFYLNQIAAPAILRLPFHQCAYDLWPRCPESLVGIGAFAMGTLAIGWSATTTALGCAPATMGVMIRRVRQLEFLALTGHSTAFLFFFVEWVTA